MKRILVCDGGGIRGLYTAEILAGLESLIGKRCYQVFDLIAGTSTGGILACGLGLTIPAAQMRCFYQTKASQIFSTSLLNKINPFRPKYDGVGLEKALTTVFSNNTYENVHTKIMCTSFDLQLNRTAHFKSYDPQTDNMSLVDVARATSAAPTYFPAKTISMTSIVPAFGKFYKQVTKNIHVYIDGGLCANDPSIHAYIEAMNLWPGEEIKLLSIGTGYVPDRYDTNSLSNAGAAQWIKSLFSIFMDGGADDVDYCCKIALKDNYLRIQDQLPPYISPKMDCITDNNLKNLFNFANKVSGPYAINIKEFLYPDPKSVTIIKE